MKKLPSFLISIIIIYDINRLEIIIHNNSKKTKQKNVVLDNIYLEYEKRWKQGSNFPLITNRIGYWYKERNSLINRYSVSKNEHSKQIQLDFVHGKQQTKRFGKHQRT